MALRKWNTNFRLEHSVLELKIMTIHFQLFRCSWKFSAGTDAKVVFRLLPNQIFGKHFVNSKQPVLSFSGWDLYVVNF